MRRPIMLLTTMFVLLSPSALSAQFGLVESLFRNVTDIGFYVGRSGMGVESGDLVVGRYGLSNFGVELLFELGASGHMVSVEPRDTAQVRWTEMRVVRGDDGRVDTTFVYAVTRPATHRLERVWTFELAIGYGQLAGFALRDPEFELLGTARELPALTFYASHASTGAYLGIRSGMLQTHALQVVDTAGTALSGAAQAFQIGLAIGMAIEVATIFPFAEVGWQQRRFPSVEWRATTLPPSVPRSIDLSGWQVQVGVQVPIRRN
jgi:hypothetical protein